MFLIGVLPAFLTLWIRYGMPESALWQGVHERRQAARKQAQTGAVANGHSTRFTLFDLFSDPESRRNTFVALLMSLTTTLAWWGISSWVPPTSPRRRPRRTGAPAMGELCGHGL